MKKLTLLLLLSTTAYSQTYIDLSGLNSNITLGQNCSQSQTPQQFITNGDANLNGYTVHLKNSILTITNNLNGSGQITTCGQSSFCVNGSIQNNTTYDEQDYCQTLSVDAKELNIKQIPLNINYTIYNIKGQVLRQGRTCKRMYSDLIKKQVILLRVDGYKVKRIYKY